MLVAAPTGWLRVRLAHVQIVSPGKNYRAVVGGDGERCAVRGVTADVADVDAREQGRAVLGGLEAVVLGGEPIHDQPGEDRVGHHVRRIRAQPDVIGVALLAYQEPGAAEQRHVGDVIPMKVGEAHYINVIGP